MTEINDLQSLLLYQMQCLLHAEQQVQKAIPEIIKKARHRSLIKALQHHADLTGEQIKRIEEVVNIVANRTGDINTFPTEQHMGVHGLISELNNLLSLKLSNNVIDAAIISGVQKIEHYEITSYGTALTYAQELNLHKAAGLLEETLNEEYDADDLLTALATASLNKSAMPVSAPDHSVDKIANEDSLHSDPFNRSSKVSINERNVNSPGGRAGRSHKGYNSGESRGH